jgi:heat shock protein HslJ
VKFEAVFRHAGRRFCVGLFVLAMMLASAVNASAADRQPLICFGNEPSWRLDLTTPDRASFSTPDTAAVDYVGSATGLPPRQESIWRGQAVRPGGGELVAFLREGPCSDGMSETLHPYSINLSLPGGRHYTGCCRLAEVAVDRAAFESVNWRLVELPGQQPAPVQTSQAITVTFENGHVHGFSGCNRFMGSYALEGNRLGLGNLGGTMMACPEPLMSLEGAFLQAFAGTQGIAIAGNTLTLTPVEGGGPLRFERMPPPQLEGIQWEVTGFNNGRQAVVSPKLGTRLTVLFENGRVSGGSGCNRFQGLYTVAGNELAIHNLGTTRMACEGSVMAQEQEFLMALQSATTWDIVRGMLDMHRADGQRALTASALDD